MLRFDLDGISIIMCVCLLLDRKKSKSLKEQAEKHCDKRIKEYTKRQQKLEQNMSDDLRATMFRPPTVLSDWKQRLWSSSQGNLKNAVQREHLEQQATLKNIHSLYASHGQRFSSLTGGTIAKAAQSSVQRRAQAMKNARQMPSSISRHSMADDFKIGEVGPAGKRSVRSLQGFRRDSEVIYVGTFSSSGEIIKRGKIADVFDVDAEADAGTEADTDTYSDGESRSSRGTNSSLGRSLSQPDFICNEIEEEEAEDDADDELNEDVLLHRRSGLFDRPMFGTLAFRQSVTAALSELQPDTSSSSGLIV